MISRWRTRFHPLAFMGAQMGEREGFDEGSAMAGLEEAVHEAGGLGTTMRRREMWWRFHRVAMGEIAFLALLTVWAGVADAWQPAAAQEPSGPSPRASTTSLRVALRRATLSAEVREQPWAEFLAEVTRTTGIRLHLQPRPTGLISTSFRDLPVERALRHVFGPEADFVYRYDSSPDGACALPTEVWIFRRDAEGPAAAQAESGRAAPVSIAAREDDQARRAEIRATAEQHLWVGAPVLIEALRDVDPNIRKDAAVGLTSLRDDTVVDDLEGLIWHEPDPELRATVAEILATIASPRALAAIRAALADSEPLVRTRAVAALINFGGQAGLAFLRDAVRGGPEEAQDALRAISLEGSKTQKEVP